MTSKKRLYSRVIEFNPITLSIVWEYTKKDFFSPTQGSAQRLPNGNTLITESLTGRIFEVTRNNEIVWEYKSNFLDTDGLTTVYRAYRIPPEWVPGNPAGYEFWDCNKDKCNIT